MRGVKLTTGPYVQHKGEPGPSEITFNKIAEFDIRGKEDNNYIYTSMTSGVRYSNEYYGIRTESNRLRFTNGEGENSQKYIRKDNIPYDRQPETMLIMTEQEILAIGNLTTPYDDPNRLIFSANNISYYLASVDKNVFNIFNSGGTFTRINHIIIYIKFDNTQVATIGVQSSNPITLWGGNYTLAIAPVKFNKLINKDFETRSSGSWIKNESVKGAIETSSGYSETQDWFIAPIFTLLNSSNNRMMYSQIDTSTVYQYRTNNTIDMVEYSMYTDFGSSSISQSSVRLPSRPITIFESDDPSLPAGVHNITGGEVFRTIAIPYNYNKYPGVYLIKTLAFEYDPKSNNIPVYYEGHGGEGSFEGYDKIISDSTDGLNGHLWSDYNGMFKSSVSNYLFGHYPINDVNDTNAARHLIGASQRFTWGNFTKLFNKKDLDLDDLFVRGYFLPFKAAYITPDTTWTESVPTYGLFNEPIASKTFTEATGESVVKALTSSFDTTAANNVLTTLGKESNAIAFVTTEPYYYRRSLFRFQKIDYGTKEIKILFDDYNDFINTSYKLTLPFGGGEHELNPNELFRDKDGNKVTTCLLEIYGIIDLDSGMMLLNVISNENMILQTSVNPAVDIILTGRNDARIVSGVATTAAATAATVAAIATKGLSKINQTQESNTAKEEAEFRKDLAERRIINQEKNTDIRQDETVETRRRNDIMMEQNKILREGRVNK